LKRAAAKTTSGILRLSFSAADIANACAFAWEEGRRKCLACLTSNCVGIRPPQMLYGFAFTAEKSRRNISRN
jgi:hypothetical protein